MKLPDFLLILMVNLAWGFNFIAGKYGADHFQPLFFTSLRFLILLVLMLPWLKPLPGQMKPLLTVSFLMGVLHFGMIFLGIYASGNIASVAIATQLYIPFSAILAVVFLKERMTMIKIVAIAVALSGVFVTGFDPVVFDHLDAILWIIGACLAIAIATIIMRQCPDLGVFRLQAWIALVAAPSLFLLSLLFETGHSEIVTDSTLIDFWPPVYSAVAASIGGHGVVYYLLGRHPVSVVTPLLLLAPVFASIFGILLFGDDLGGKMVVGGLMTLSGILLVSIEPGFAKGKKELS